MSPTIGSLNFSRLVRFVHEENPRSKQSYAKQSPDRKNQKPRNESLNKELTTEIANATHRPAATMLKAIACAA